MPRSWRLLDRVETPEGALELRTAGPKEFMILVGGRVLMSSHLHRTELTLARLGCGPIRDRAAPRVLIGGLGLGYTLRAALDTLPASAKVEVAELNPVVVDWCKGPVAELADRAVFDPRVTITVADVTDRIRAAAAKGPRLDAIVVDLYVGPAPEHGANDPLYGAEILARTREALAPGGVYAVWGEERYAPFEGRLRDAGFEVELVLAEGGGPRHPVYLATRR